MTSGRWVEGKQNISEVKFEMKRKSPLFGTSNEYNRS